MSTKPEEKPAEKKKRQRSPESPIVAAAKALEEANTEIAAFQRRRAKHIAEAEQLAKDIAVLEKSRAEHQAALKKATGA